MAIAVICGCIILLSGINAHAASDSVSIVSIDYDKSIITVQMNTNDKMKKWEFVPAAPDSVTHRVQLDFSWISENSDYTISFKGDASTTPIKVKISKRNTSLKATYNTYTGKVKFDNLPSGRTIQWKKADAFQWNDYDESSFEEQISSFIANGAKLSIRIAAVAGTSEDDPGYRAGKEITLTIPKKSAAPAVSIDDANIAIQVEKGMEYRKADRYGNPLTEWTEITKTELKLISELAPEVMCDQATMTSGETVYLQFRRTKTASTTVSNIKTLKIPGQNPLSEDALRQCGIVYTSSTTFDINVPVAGGDYTYEYCIINQDDIIAGVTINTYERLTWKTVPSTAVISIDMDKDDVEDTSLVYVRRAHYLTYGEDDYELASPAMALTNESVGIKYPGEITTVDGTMVWLQTIAGVCTPANTEGYLTFSFYSPGSNVISKIEFVDYYSSKSRGTLTYNNEYKCTVTANPAIAAADFDSYSGDDKYIINVTIMDTSKLDSYSKITSDTDTRRMLAYITLKGSDEVSFKSTAEKGIGLYIHPATTVANPASGDANENECKEIAAYLTDLEYADEVYAEWLDYDYSTDKIGFTNKIVRIVDSERYYDENDSIRSKDGFWDASQFRIVLNFGTRYNPSQGTEGTMVASDANHVTVTKIKYDGVEFTPGPVSGGAFSVDYADILSDEEDGKEEIRMAVLTINADVIEKNTVIDDRNTDTPVIIYLSNGEILKTALTMNLQETATISGGSNSWTITSGSLKETDTITETTSNGTTTTTTDHVDRTITLNEYSNLSNVSLISVTWSDGIREYSVCTNINHSDHKYTMDLSNKEINKISVTSTKSSYLVFRFDNGFEITTGWKLTINPSVTD